MAVLALLDPELLLEQIVDGLRARFAPCGLHHLTDKPAGERRLQLRLLSLFRIGGDPLVRCLLYGALVGYLGESPRLNYRLRIAAFSPHDVEQILGDLA